MDDALERGGHETPADEEIAAWYVRLTSDEATAADQRAFRAWLDGNPGRAVAWWQLLQTLGRTDDALADPAAPIDLFQGSDPTQLGTEFRTGSRRRMVAVRAIAAGIFLAVAAGLGLPLWQRAHYTTVATAVGEARRLVLPDGTQLHLNTGTRLSWSTDGATRRVHFEDGEAYFVVAKDPSRPFVISVGGREVRVLGTAFNIRHLAERTDVAVSEGNVGLSGEVGWLRSLLPSDIPQQQLTAGTQVSYGSGSGQVLRSRVAERAIAPWRHGQLIYRAERLADVIADLDRYFPGTLVVRGQTVADLKVSAVINLGDEPQILSTLAQQLPIRVTHRSEGITEISAAP